MRSAARALLPSLRPRTRLLALVAGALAIAFTPAGPPSPGATAPVTVAFLGSSTSAGSGASDPAARWTSVLARQRGWIEVNLGLPGSKLVAREREREPVVAGEERWPEVVRARPDVVFVMYGANDADARVTLGDEETPGTFRHAAGRLLQRLREALPAAILVVVTPQPAHALAGKREPYDAALAEAARAAGALFVPAGEAFDPARLDRYAADRIHLNDDGHAALAAFVQRSLDGREPTRLGALGPPRSPDAAAAGPLRARPR